MINLFFVYLICSSLISGDGTLITSDDRPKDRFFDWFFDPLMIIKEQIKAENFSEEEENYLSKLVLLHGDSKRLKNLNARSPPLNERRRAEIDAFARRYQGNSSEQLLLFSILLS